MCRTHSCPACFTSCAHQLADFGLLGLVGKDGKVRPKNLGMRTPSGWPFFFNFSGVSFALWPAVGFILINSSPCRPLGLLAPGSTGRLGPTFLKRPSKSTWKYNDAQRDYDIHLRTELPRLDIFSSSSSHSSSSCRLLFAPK